MQNIPRSTSKEHPSQDRDPIRRSGFFCNMHGVDTILATLGPEQLVLDLGCGGGSFQYSAYKCRIVGVDVHLDENGMYTQDGRISYLQADSHALPLERNSVDFAVCNHSLEHIARLRETLAELGRVLKPTGFLWISVPNGFAFDDGLYRFLYAGGGHVNRFTFSGLKDEVESITGLRLLQSNVLTSSFIYCKLPPASAWPYLPRRLKVLQRLGLLGPFSRTQLNVLSRFLDRLLDSRFSQYGWGFLFGTTDRGNHSSLPSYFNVCASCGAGHAARTLWPGAFKRWTLSFYRCPRCNERNLLFEPPAGFD
jgi:SAM-dependent methyltransferase